MLLKKGFLISLCVLGISYGCYFLYPHAQQYWQKRFKQYIEEQLAETIQLKTTRVIPDDADLGSYLAGYFAKQDKNYHYASHYFQKVLQKDENYHDIKKNLFVYQTITGEIDKAIPLAHQIVNSSENIFLVSPILIADFFSRNEYQKVLDFLNTAQSSYADTFTKPLLSAWAYAGLNREKEAFDALNELTAEEFKHIYLYHKGLLLTYFKKYDEALVLYQNMSPNQIYSINTLTSIADVALKNGQIVSDDLIKKLFVPFFQQSFQAYDIYRHFQLEPISTPQEAVAEVYQTFSTYFYRNDMPEVTLALNNVALYLNPKSNLIKLYVAESYDSIDMFDYAHKMFHTIDHKSNLILSKMALNHMKQGHYEQAISMFDNLLKTNPKDYFLHQLIAQSYMEIQKHENALEHLKQAYYFLSQQKKTHELIEVLLLQAQIYDHLNQTDKAIATSYEAYHLAPANAFVLNSLGYQLIDYNLDVSKGLGFVLQAHQIMPDNPQILDSVAWGYYKSGDYSKALKYAQKAVRDMHSNAVLYMHLGDIYLALQRKQEAFSSYQKALKADDGRTPQIESLIQKKLDSLQPEE